MVGRQSNSARSGHGGTISTPSGLHARTMRGLPPSAQLSEAGRHPRWPVYALVAVLSILGVDLYGLLDQWRVNTMLGRGEIALVAERDTPRGQLARAYRLHASGKLKEAIAAYGAIASDSEPALRKAQYFNLANLYLERAAELERADDIQPAMSLVELAKQHYREILAQDPRHWDSRYNLSRALEMLPDIAAVDYQNERNPERSPQAPQAARTYEGLP